MANSSKTTKPISFRVRAYQVGFGDCFLLTFKYSRGKNSHVLVDFGSVALPADAPKDQLQKIASDIQKECGKDMLTAVVETHRHRDHISGFSTQGKNSPGTVIKNLKPSVVLHPWTEDPNAQPSATTATGNANLKAFVGRLDMMKTFSGRAYEEAKQLQARNWRGFASELAFAGENGLSNDSAVRNLIAMSPKHEYLNCGSSTSLNKLLPGVQVWVLGPPTLKQTTAIKKESSTNPNEFWQLQKETVALNPARYMKGAKAHKGDYPAGLRWFIRKADSVRADQLLGLVRILDKALNNTSLIVLFEIGGKKFLFPGDAQLENWSFALSQPKLKALLTGIELYKVGHHGSRNATPKTMWNQVKSNAASDLNSVVSTLSGVYGKAEKKTEVPRTTLISELKQHSVLYSTQGQTDLFHDVTFAF